MQEKYKKLYEHFIGKLVEKLNSKEEAEEVFAEIGLPVILESTKKILDEVEKIAGSETAKEVGQKLSGGQEVEAFQIVFDLGIDGDQIMKDVFLDIFAGVMNSSK